MEIAAYLQAGLEIEVPAVSSNNGGQNVCHRRESWTASWACLRGVQRTILPAIRQPDLMVRVDCPPLHGPFRMGAPAKPASFQAPALPKLISVDGRTCLPFAHDLDHEPYCHWNCRCRDIRRRRLRSPSESDISDEPVGQRCPWRRRSSAGYGSPAFRIAAPRAGAADHIAKITRSNPPFAISSRIGMSRDRHCRQGYRRCRSGDGYSC